MCQTNVIQTTSTTSGCYSRFPVPVSIRHDLLAGTGIRLEPLA